MKKRRMQLASSQYLVRTSSQTLCPVNESFLQQKNLERQSTCRLHQRTLRDSHLSFVVMADVVVAAAQKLLRTKKS